MFWDKIRWFCPLRFSFGSRIVGFVAWRRGQNSLNLGLLRFLIGTILLAMSQGNFNAEFGEDRRGGVGDFSLRALR